MALMFGNGALWYGSSVEAGSFTSTGTGASRLHREAGLIGDSYELFTMNFGDMTGSAVSSDVFYTLTTEITCQGNQGTVTMVGMDPAVDGVPPTSDRDKGLETSIIISDAEGASPTVPAPLNMIGAGFVEISITELLEEPTIKDITHDLQVIDHLETDERTSLQTEAV